MRTNRVKVLIELPTWLGDSVMATLAIENIVNYYSDVEITLIGPSISTQVFIKHPKVNKIVLLEKNFLSLFKMSSFLESFDAFFTFRSSLRSKILKLLVKSKNKYQFNKAKYPKRHQVKKYVDFVSDSLNIEPSLSDLVIYTDSIKKEKSRKLLGINPGASYGSAKRWYPKQFAQIVIDQSSNFETIIFGGQKEKDFAKEIETILIKNKINNFINLAGKTSISQLINHISNLDILITGDSGPMHIAAALKVPTISIFGPTDEKETSQWRNPNSLIIKKNLDCQPCMQRICPLKHHNCMKQIKPRELIDSIPLIIK